MGSETFPFPVVINSRLFNPNDPRSHVLLNEVDDPEINQNKELVEEVVALYNKLLIYCADHNVQRMYELARFDRQITQDWIDKDWYKAHVADPITTSLSTQKLVDNAAGNRIAIYEDKQPTIFFPSAADSRVRKMLYDLAIKWLPHGVPAGQDIDKWASVLWPTCPKLAGRRAHDDDERDL